MGEVGAMAPDGFEEILQEVHPLDLVWLAQCRYNKSQRGIIKEEDMSDSFEEGVKEDFVLIMGALADQRDAGQRLESSIGLIQRDLAAQRDATQRLEIGMTHVYDHILKAHAAKKQSDVVLDDHETRIQKLEKTPPAA